MMKVIPYSGGNVGQVLPTQSGSYIRAQQQRVLAALKASGANRYDLMLPETNILPQVLHPFEEITAAVYGKYSQERIGQSPLVGRGLLVATNKRILFIDKKPMFVRSSEISYLVIAGVTYTRVGFSGKITLLNKTGDIRLRTFNQTCAYLFVKAVEQHLYTLPGPLAEVGP